MRTIELGGRAMTVALIDYEPHTTVLRGEFGTITQVLLDDAGAVEAIEIKLDTYHKGLAEWDNHVLLTAPEHEAVLAFQNETAVAA